MQNLYARCWCQSGLRNLRCMHIVYMSPPFMWPSSSCWLVLPVHRPAFLVLSAPFLYALLLLPNCSHDTSCLLPSSWSHHLICRPAPKLHPCCKLAVPQVPTRKWSTIWWASAKVGNMPLRCLFGHLSALCMLLGGSFVPAVMPMEHAPKG